MGILIEEIDVKVTSNVIKHYERLGYTIPKRIASKNNHSAKKGSFVYDLGAIITVRVEDLPKDSTVRVPVECDYCKRKKMVKYQDYRKSTDSHGTYTCSKCGYIHAQQTMESRYGEKSPVLVPEFREKQYDSMTKKYGVMFPQQSSKIREKTKQTNLQRYNSEYTVTNPEIKEKGRIRIQELYGVDNVFSSSVIQNQIRLTCLKKYGEKSVMRVDEIKERAAKTLSINGNVRTSTQQKYLHNLYGGILNGVVSFYNVDILLEQAGIALEYDGSGHFLNVIFGNVTQEEFVQKEIVRSAVIERAGYKILRFISHIDKLPSDAKLLEILNLSRKYFADYPNHSWIEWHFDDGIYRNAEAKNGLPFDYGPLHSLRKQQTQPGVSTPLLYA